MNKDNRDLLEYKATDYLFIYDAILHVLCKHKNWLTNGIVAPYKGAIMDFIIFYQLEGLLWIRN